MACDYRTRGGVPPLILAVSSATPSGGAGGGGGPGYIAAAKACAEALLAAGAKLMDKDNHGAT